MKARENEMPGVTFSTGWQGKHYIGTAEALETAGLLTLDQLPGLRGMPSTSATYVNGVRQPRTARPVHDNAYKRISKVGRKFQVTIRFSEVERLHREQAEEQERKASVRIETDLGSAVACDSMLKASAVFNMSDSVRIRGCAAVVHKGYGVHKVRNEEDGEYVDADGEVVDYRHGYVIQYLNGEEYFEPACHLTRVDGAPTHLRLVGGASVRDPQMMALRE